MEISTADTKGWTLQFVKETLIAVDEEGFRRYVTDLLGSIHYCDVESVLDDGHVSLLRAHMQSYTGYGTKMCRLVNRQKGN